MSKLVTIYGGSGFVGRYVARRMAKLGWRVRVAVRRPNEALFVRPYGTVGQVEPVLCNIRNDESVRSVMMGADAVVNFLIGQGISRARLEAVVSFGETQPLIVTQGRERRNRRTVTEVSGFVAGHPMLLDGNYAAVVYREYLVSGEPASTFTTGVSTGTQADTSDSSAN